MSADKIDYSKFIYYLEQLCDAGVSGTLYMTCEQNHSARMVIAAGKVIFISYSNRKGNDAIAAMPTIDKISYRFDTSNSAAVVDSSLPPTAVIIRNIAPIGYISDGQGMVEATAGEMSPAVVSQALPIHIKKQLNNLLLDLVGPMGDFLYADYVENATSKEEVVVNLAKELSISEMNAIHAILR
ncbi:hypothetical protein [Psychrobacter sp. I-STPA6b]|uniref:hypothetical protein n=1 Tax=Psychrobacter sp. I-STPA6b TaxID=2585718 RepID=UPI001D0CC6E4|nr:hypothetical protein [Psychrobacter sp. I-STPA6b]